ncbi:MAG: GNAT family N-acetyltransferase [Candidatus Lokiarchaeota archaeon]|nr:GNAT family N-acetyltransferase [Candidatus Lokiarchaeota archaeon]
MKAQLYEDIYEFYDLSFPFLIKREVENGLLLSILNYLKDNVHRYGKEMPLLLALLENDDIKLIALMTPPHNLIISHTDDMTSIEIIIEELLKQKKELPGVLSFKEAANKFAKLWCEKKSLKFQVLRNERIYKLVEVSKDTLGTNKFTVATKVYQSLVLKWASEMLTEAIVEVSEEALERNRNNIKKELEEGNSRIYLIFDKNEPVSMARKSGKTLNGTGINLVYTPPPLRRKGYATECVAKLSKLILEEGNDYCFLFTDLSNPVSNSIYQKIGYRAVIDVDEIKFIKQIL